MGRDPETTTDKLHCQITEWLKLLYGSTNLNKENQNCDDFWISDLNWHQFYYGFISPLKYSPSHCFD